MQPFSAVEFSVQRDPQFHQDVTCDDRVLGNSSQYSQVSLGDKRRSMSQKNRNLRKAMVGREGRCSKGNSLHEARRCGIMTCLKHTKSSLMEQGVGLGEVGCEPEDGVGVGTSRRSSESRYIWLHALQSVTGAALLPLPGQLPYLRGSRAGRAGSGLRNKNRTWDSGRTLG